MSEIKQLDPRALAGITTGVLLVSEGFPAIHEAIEHVLGRPVWTHELPQCWNEARAAVLAQFPEMPTDVGGDYQATADAVRAKYGDRVPVHRGSTVRALDPITTARMVFGEASEATP